MFECQRMFGPGHSEMMLSSTNVLKRNSMFEQRPLLRVLMCADMETSPVFEKKLFSISVSAIGTSSPEMKIPNVWQLLKRELRIVTRSPA